MCNHEFVKTDNMRACKKCGLTILNNGRVLFDKEITNYKPKRKKRGKK